MDKNEYQKQKEEIIKTYGQPNDQYDEPNESRKRLNELLKLHRSQGHKEKAEVRKSELNKLAEELPKPFRAGPALPVYLTDEDLRPFTDEERKIVIAYLEDTSQDDKAIGDRLGVSWQKVTRTKRCAALRELLVRRSDDILKAENLAALRKAQLSGDTKIITALGQKYGHLNKDELEITNKVKPIDDPALLKMLKQIADKVVDSGDDSKRGE